MSDFWADLQRWTEAQVAAILRGRIEARRKDYLAADINKLLRDRINEPLAIKVGDKILAEFLRNSRNGNFPYPFEPVFEFECGWRTIETPLVSWIAVWAALADYYGTGGFSNECNPTGSPTLDEDLRYQSAWNPGAIADPQINPSRYTGLMRLFMQSLVSMNREYEIEFPYPGDWDDPDEIGLARSPGGNYWLIKVSRTYGILAGKLSVPIEYECMATLANGGTLSGFSQQIADAAVIGNLVQALDEFGDPIWTSLMSYDDEDLTAVYADGFEPLAWKWCWRYQTRGEPNADVAGAVICTHKSTVISEFYETRDLQYRESVLIITFNEDGVPAASIAENTTGYFPLMDSLYGSMPLHIYKASNTEITTLATSAFIRQPSGGTSEVGIMASCYAPDNSLARVEVLGRASDDPGGSFPPTEWVTSYCKQSKTVEGNNIEIEKAPYIAFNNLTVSSLSDNGGIIEEYEECWGTDVYVPGSPDRYTVSMFTILKRTTASTTNSVIISTECPGVVWMVGDHGQDTYTLNQSNAGSTRDCFYGFNYLQNPDCDIYGNFVTEAIISDTLGPKLMTIVGEDSWLKADDSAEYTAVNAILSDASPYYLGAVASTGLDAFVSYSHLPNVIGADLPAGIDADACALPGLWIGGA